MQSTLGIVALSGMHVAMIMDGNGRWANARGLPRVAGHRAGARAVRRVVEAAPGLGVGTLTLYAFSSDNWQRPPREVGALARAIAGAEAATAGGTRLHLRLAIDYSAREAILRAAALAAGREVGRGEFE